LCWGLTGENITADTRTNQGAGSFVREVHYHSSLVVWTSILVEEEMNEVAKIGERVVEEMPLRRYQSHATIREDIPVRPFLLWASLFYPSISKTLPPEW